MALCKYRSYSYSPSCFMSLKLVQVPVEKCIYLLPWLSKYRSMCTQLVCPSFGIVHLIYSHQSVSTNPSNQWPITERRCSS